ncbi:uncharacterized protein FOMMEDRAFT_28263 [Fomitiporia mediterranea MF3/22]|uniref:uncharacterized protein n=1 Tax=Fomitiporia mediterranea (strain MF3/22) TaxID=694068 RepID=UPI0004408F80|nr:uncharacterized protein FOMMEDRAFT_28263 [Fomitiporia mediterranea MF3/22]EJD04618.1 hypothetical protein FOMMEDRAFT_28263 [Fomitiporia mediterranea MF3/22]
MPVRKRQAVSTGLSSEDNQSERKHAELQSLRGEAAEAAAAVRDLERVRGSYSNAYGALDLVKRSLPNVPERGHSANQRLSNFKRTFVPQTVENPQVITFIQNIESLWLKFTAQELAQITYATNRAMNILHEVLELNPLKSSLQSVQTKIYSVSANIDDLEHVKLELNDITRTAISKKNTFENDLQNHEKYETWNNEFSAWLAVPANLQNIRKS